MTTVLLFLLLHIYQLGTFAHSISAHRMDIYSPSSSDTPSPAQSEAQTPFTEELPTDEPSPLALQLPSPISPLLSTVTEDGEFHFFNSLEDGSPPILSIFPHENESESAHPMPSPAGAILAAQPDASLLEVNNPGPGQQPRANLPGSDEAINFVAGYDEIRGALVMLQTDMAKSHCSTLGPSKDLDLTDRASSFSGLQERVEALSVAFAALEQQLRRLRDHEEHNKGMSLIQACMI